MQTLNTQNLFDKKAHKLFINGNIKDAINILLDKLKTNNNICYDQIAYYYARCSQYKEAYFFYTKCLNQNKNNKYIEKILGNIITICFKLKEYSKCIEYSNKLLSINPNHINAFDGLSHAFSELGNIEEACRAGNKALLLKDQSATNNIKKIEIIKDKDISDILTLSDTKKNVCSFSLFGNNSRYLRGAIYNVIVGKELFPEWSMRFYVDETVPCEIKNALIGLDAEVIEQKKCQSNDMKFFWRFFVASDPNVGRFIIRDCDSAFSLREAIIVNEWIDSGKLFHVIRDHLWHTDLILAGLWGGVACVIPDIRHMIDEFLIKEAGKNDHNDQKFLGKYIWPIIKKSCIIHDRYFDAFSPNRPPMKYFRTKNDHIGANRFATDKDWQEKCLAPWIRELPCLCQQKKISINLAEFLNKVQLKKQVNIDISGKQNHTHRNK